MSPGVAVVYVDDVSVVVLVSALVSAEVAAAFASIPSVTRSLIN